MALYAIGDLHLCLGAPKPMDIFGGAWVGYMEKLRRGLSILRPEDTTVLMGDLSWALDLESAKADFEWIARIPGRKIILKGNHDYWWSTAAKFQKFCQENRKIAVRADGIAVDDDGAADDSVGDDAVYLLTEI